MKHRRMRESNTRPVVSHDPPIQQQEAPLSERGARFWPDGEPMPTAFKRQALQPCPECRRVLMDDGGRAVAVASSAKDMAYFRCKVCGARWKLPTEQSNFTDL